MYGHAPAVRVTRGQSRRRSQHKLCGHAPAVPVHSRRRLQPRVTASEQPEPAARVTDGQSTYAAALAPGLSPVPVSDWPSSLVSPQYGHSGPLTVTGTVTADRLGVTGTVAHTGTRRRTARHCTARRYRDGSPGRDAARRRHLGWPRAACPGPRAG